MKKLLVIDRHNYDGITEEIVRKAVRGIIFRGSKLLLVQGSDGVPKLPGGGQDEGEDNITTLCREVREETGFNIDPSTVKEFGSIEEKRLSYYEPLIFHQFNDLYLCEITGEQIDCEYSRNELERGFRPVWYTPEEALERLSATRENTPESREFSTFLLIKDYIREKEKK